MPQKFELGICTKILAFGSDRLYGVLAAFRVQCRYPKPIFTFSFYLGTSMQTEATVSCSKFHWISGFLFCLSSLGFGPVYSSLDFCSCIRNQVFKLSPKLGFGLNPEVWFLVLTPKNGLWTKSSQLSFGCARKLGFWFCLGRYVCILILSLNLVLRGFFLDFGASTCPQRIEFHLIDWKTGF